VSADPIPGQRMEKLDQELAAVRADLLELRERAREFEERLQAQRAVPPGAQRVREISAEERAALREQLMAEDLVVHGEIENLNWDAPNIAAKVLGLSAHALHGISASSTLGTWLEGMTIGDVAAISYAEVRPADVEELEDEARVSSQFRQVVLKASRVASLVSRLQQRS
jgi:hypothetical protein